MKRVPPYIGYAVLEADDLEQLNEKQLRQLLAVQVAILGLFLGMVAQTFWQVML